MKCKVLIGPAGELQYHFNKWAQGKSLSRDVIIHTHVTMQAYNGSDEKPLLTIVIFHPEGKPWEETEDALATMAQM